MNVQNQVKEARQAAYRMAVARVETRNAVIRGMASLLAERQADILAANATDASRATEAGLGQSVYKRLVLSERKLGVMIDSLESVARLPDPLGAEEVRRELDAGLVLSRVRVPIGVVGVIFESRPDALVQIASLGIKSGNAVILKGGSEALESNRVLHALFVEAVAAVDDSLSGALQLVETREDISAVLELDDDIDLMIPRGSNELVRYIQQHTRIPVLGHADGICHVYIHPDAEPAMATAVVRDSKMQYPAVCNAVETLLVHADAIEMLHAIVEALSGVELRGCARTREVVPMAEATDEDWTTEYNDLVLSIRVVDSPEEAIAHINRYGSRHTDAIVTASSDAAARFMREVDSSSVLWNASTRFADGFRYGLGAEVGISTGKVHARGPVGLEGLTTTQYRVTGNGHIVDDYAEGRKQFTHRTLKEQSGS
ncbi:MAG: glutamate-5-semialdehyde dehydrogenase [Spirochaetaceae bacterium]|nr:MAG: glutamate-5-semialdehyde dehydrogenase [Spirochaetaceae bacterium]